MITLATILLISTLFNFAFIRQWYNNYRRRKRHERGMEELKRKQDLQERVHYQSQFTMCAECEYQGYIEKGERCPNCNGLIIINQFEGIEAN